MANRMMCDGVAFRGLANPYTGEPIKVEMVVTAKGPPLFHSALRTYSTSDLQPTFGDARRMWSRVGGVEGAKGPAVPMTCAYTGRPLTPVRTERGVYLAGGFDPNLLLPRDDFLRMVRMRDGKSPVPAAAARVEPVRRPPPARPRTASSPEPTDASMEVVEAAAKEAGVSISSGAVSMSSARKGKRR